MTHQDGLQENPLSGMPARSSEASERVENLHEFIMNTVVHNDPHAAHENSLVARRTLLSYPDETLRNLSEHFRKHITGMSADVPSMLVQQGRPASVINEFLEFCPEPPVRFVFTTSIQHVLLGIHQYSQLPSMDDYSEANPEVKEQVAALILFALLMEDEFDGSLPTNIFFTDGEQLVTVKGSGLIDLICEYPSKARSIAEVVINRRIQDADFLRDVITNSAPALNEGIL